MSLTENQFRMGFVIDNGKIGDGNFGCDCGTGDGLVWSGSNKRDKRDKQGQGKIHGSIVPRDGNNCQGV